MESTSGPPGRLGWYARRLASMSPAEVLWRGWRTVAARRPSRHGARRLESRLVRPGVDWDELRVRFGAATGRPVLLDRAAAQALAGRHPELTERLVAAARRVREGQVRYFGYPGVTLSDPVDWAHDLVSDVRWPSRAAARIDHRTSPADPKWIWELNRLQHLPWLAQAWLLTGDDGFADHALDHLDSWLEQNPAGQGIAWRGAFEVGIRALSVCVALQGLRDYPGLTSRRLQAYATMLAAGADLCWRERSRFSSANNHLVGELAGLAAVALFFPELAGAERWCRRALRGLAREAERQILPDGAGAEQAVGYQVFTAELLAVVAALLRSGRREPPREILAALDRSADYLATLVGSDDPEPRYGDDDQGFALRLGPEPRRTVRDHLAVVAAVTGNERARAAGSSNLTSAWLAGPAGRGAATAGPGDAQPAGGLVARHGGLVVLRAGGRRVTMDVGPLGYLSIAAHGHADALAVTLSLDGGEVVSDPGTGSYYGHPDWREVQRSTAAHPTVTVDGVSQSTSGGPFLWTRHARTRVRSIDLAGGVVDAEHDGYHQLRHPVTHRRWLLAPSGAPTVLVVDQLTGTGDHDALIRWPLHPSIEVVPLAQGYRLARAGARVAELSMAATAQLGFEQVRGDADRHLGWWSECLEERLPAWWVAGRLSGPLPVVVCTLIQHGDAAAEQLTVDVDAETIAVSWRVAGRAWAATVRPGADGGATVGPAPS